jgi:hypothetical protein
MADESVIIPSYYNKTNMSVIDIIDEYELNFNKGNIIKYVLRSGKKSKDTEIQDLQKAIRYCQMEIERIQKREMKNEQ